MPSRHHLSWPRLIIAVLGLWLISGSAAISYAQIDSEVEQQILALLNQERARHGLQSLPWDSRLIHAARQHTALMVQHNALSHQFEDEPSLEIRFANQELPSDQQAENVAVAEDAASINRAFMHSAPHRANILNPDYNAVGIGAFRSGGRLWVTEDFARRLKQYSEPEAEDILERTIDSYAVSHGVSRLFRQPESRLRSMACDMARNDALNSQAPAGLPGVWQVFVWTTGDPAKLPQSVKEFLARPVNSGYSLGACFAPSVSHPGGVYWVVMVVR